jgi:ABC-type proline/glycine betaine transport system permease subunit
MSEEKKGLDNTTIWLMVSVAFFFDVLQWLLDFIFMSWLVTIFAWLTFYVWFKMRGISFATPKRASVLGVGTIVDLIPIVGALAWTAMIITLALDSKIKKVAPVLGIIKK